MSTLTEGKSTLKEVKLDPIRNLQTLDKISEKLEKELLAKNNMIETEIKKTNQLENKPK